MVCGGYHHVGAARAVPRVRTFEAAGVLLGDFSLCGSGEEAQVGGGLCLVAAGGRVMVVAVVNVVRGKDCWL